MLYSIIILTVVIVALFVYTFITTNKLKKEISLNRMYISRIFPALQFVNIKHDVKEGYTAYERFSPNGIEIYLFEIGTVKSADKEKIDITTKDGKSVQIMANSINSRIMAYSKKR